MHYRQTLIDTLTAALEVEFPGEVTDSNAFAENTSRGIRVWMVSEARDIEREHMSSSEEPRILTLRVQLVVAGHQVQSDANAAQERIEAVSRTTLEEISDCVYLDTVNWEIAAEQDRETLTADLDYSVWYVTVLGDPATRI